MDAGPGRGHQNHARPTRSRTEGTVYGRTFLVCEPLYPVTVVQTVAWSFHSAVGLLPERHPVGHRTGRCAADSRGAGPLTWFLDAAGDIDVDAHVGGHYACRRRSSISGNR